MLLAQAITLLVRANVQVGAVIQATANPAIAALRMHLLATVLPQYLSQAMLLVLLIILAVVQNVLHGAAIQVTKNPATAVLKTPLVQTVDIIPAFLVAELVHLFHTMDYHVTPIANAKLSLVQRRLDAEAIPEEHVMEQLPPADLIGRVANMELQNITAVPN